MLILMKVLFWPLDLLKFNSFKKMCNLNQSIRVCVCVCESDTQIFDQIISLSIYDIFPKPINH